MTLCLFAVAASHAEAVGARDPVDLVPGRDPPPARVVDPAFPTPATNHPRPWENFTTPHPFPPVSIGGGEEKPYARTNFFKRVFTDQKYLVTDWWPAEFRRPAFTASILGATALAMGGDPGDYENSPDARGEFWVDSRVTGTRQRIALEFTRLGNGPAFAGGLGILYLLSRFHGHSHLSDTVSLSAEALADAGIWVTGLKLVFSRVRPGNGSDGDFFQYSPHDGQDNTSFPSGHAMGAFAVASVFAHEYRDHRWVPWVSYGLAGLVGASRIGLGRHYPSDVLVGAMLGQSIGRMVVYRAEQVEDGRGHRFAPIADPWSRTYGLGFTLYW